MSGRCNKFGWGGVAGATATVALRAAEARVAPETAVTADRLSAGGWWVAGGFVALALFAGWAAVRHARRRSGGAPQTREVDGDEFEEEPEEPLNPAYCVHPPPPDEPLTFDVAGLPELTLELLRELQWKRFEELVCGYFAATGVSPQTTRVLASEPVSEIYLYPPAEHRPHTLVRCELRAKAGEELTELRRFTERLAGEGITEGVWAIAGEFAAATWSVARASAVELLDGAALLERFAQLPVEQRDRIVRRVTRGDYRSPTCPACGERMIFEAATDARSWRCRNYPRCQRRLGTR